MIEENEILTRTDLARKLNCHVNSINNWERKGLLIAHRLGRRVFFHGGEVLNALGINKNLLIK
jgi:hypothetical protein